MATLLFVHGTGVRGESYFRSLDLVCRKVDRFLPGWTVKGCPWGDPFGARLNRNGDSIPGYGESGDASSAIEDADRARWYLLGRDPLLEMRLLPKENRIGQIPGGPWIWQQFALLAGNVEITKLLDPWAVSPAWRPFIEELWAAKEWQDVVTSITQSPPAASDKVARAVVAAFQIYLRNDSFPGLTGAQRDQLRTALLQPFGGTALGIGDWFRARLTNFGMRRRGKLSDASSPAVGDILRYQARGQEIRNFIEHEATNSSSTAILAHSLGGVASVDLLASQQTSIQFLITAGSQAPYFYEIDALVSLPIGSGLPDFFPRWLNFVDPRDFLGYSAAKIFPNIARDRLVNNGQPFPESHSAYWNNDEVWEGIREFLPIS